MKYAKLTAIYFPLLIAIVFININIFESNENTLEIPIGESYEEIKLENVDYTTATFSIDGKNVEMIPMNVYLLENSNVKSFSKEAGFRLNEIKDNSVEITYSIQYENVLLIVLINSLIISLFSTLLFYFVKLRNLSINWQVFLFVL